VGGGILASGAIEVTKPAHAEVRRPARMVRSDRTPQAVMNVSNTRGTRFRFAGKLRIRACGKFGMLRGSAGFECGRGALPPCGEHHNPTRRQSAVATDSLRAMRSYLMRLPRQRDAPGARDLSDAELAHQHEKLVDLRLVAGDLDAEHVVLNVDDLCAENVAHLHDLGAR